MRSDEAILVEGVSMVIVRLIGGLGNQMFQYAVGRHLAERNSTLLKLDLSGFETYKLRRYGLHCFHISEQIATLQELEIFRRKDSAYVTKLAHRIRERLSCLSSQQRGVGNVAKPESSIGRRLGAILSSATSDFYRDTHVLRERQLSFDPSVLAAEGDIYLEAGHWQSEKYFCAIRDIVLRDFSFKYAQDAKNREVADQIERAESVSLHIRRGDYVHDPLTNQIHGLCSLDYYRVAVNYIAQKVPNCHLYVFSDDHAWVCENFELDCQATVVDHNDASSSYEDLRLMSLCRHNIIANSSFSWWGAWLNANPEKIVVSPEKWYSDPALDARDLIPESWVKVAV